MHASRGILAIRPSSLASLRALPKADVFPRFPAGSAIQSGDSKRSCSSVSNTIVFCPSIRKGLIEGQKTIVFETLEQLRFESPDWIALPAGNLGNTSAFGKALKEASELGLIARMPRLACIQAEGANPFALGFREGFARPHRVKADTVATAIKIGDPASLERAITAVRLTNGVVTDVTDGEILEAKAVVDASGAGCEPASAASVAGVKKLAAQGVIRQGDRVVAVLTGHILKDPGLLLHYHQESEPPDRKSVV